MRPPTVVSIASRWLFYAGTVLLLGAAVFRLFVATKPVLSTLALNAAWAATAIGLVLTIADHRSTTRTSLTDLLESSTGQKLKAQAVIVALTWMADCWASLRPQRAAVAAVGLGASAVMLQRALSGHADASTVPWFAVGAQWLHLVAVGAWVGGLAWLLIPLRHGDPGREPRLARRFSRVAAAGLGLVAVTGTLRAVDEVGAWSRLIDTSFGVTLLVSWGCSPPSAALGARNRFSHVAASVSAGIRGLRRVLRAEIAQRCFWRPAVDSWGSLASGVVWRTGRILTARRSDA